MFSVRCRANTAAFPLTPEIIHAQSSRTIKAGRVTNHRNPRRHPRSPRIRVARLGRHLLEELAIGGFKKDLITIAQVKRLLNLPSRFDAEQFLGNHGIAVIDFDSSELERESRLHLSSASGKSPFA
jgi:hypothetical protein